MSTLDDSRPLRVLVIDDDPGVRDVVSTTLELLANWEVYSASSGAAGIELAVQHRPDVILLDQAMPGMDGSATARELAARPETRHTPIIMLTAANPLGAYNVIEKPFDPVDLQARITELLDVTLPRPAAGSDGAVQAQMDDLWKQHRPGVVDGARRLVSLIAAMSATSGTDTALQQQARDCAHDLKGVAGTYGIGDASEAAAAAMAILDQPILSEHDRHRLAGLASAIHQRVASH